MRVCLSLPFLTWTPKTPGLPGLPGPSQQRRGFGHFPRLDCQRTAWTGRYPWTDDHAWIADMVCTRAPAGKLAILAEWVAAAGGRIDGEVALLPPLPRRLATLNLHRILGQFRIEVRDDVGL